jgi:hypothetical protein
MSDYVEILNPDPVIIPPTEEKTYPNLYCREFYVYPPNAEGKQVLNTISRPYNKSLGEMYPFDDKDYQFVIEDVFAEAERVPLFKQILGGLLVCVNLGIQERSIYADLALDPTNETLQSKLAVVHAAMGIV